MRAVIQRVSKANVRVNDVTTGTIGIGLLVFLGVEKEDTTKDIEWLAAKIPSLRVFEDEEGRMNRSVLDIDGDILVISQFTLYGNMRKGSRPSFNHAANPEKGELDYESFVDCLSKYIGKPVPTGNFGHTCTLKPATMVRSHLFSIPRIKDFEPRKKKFTRFGIP